VTNMGQMFKNAISFDANILDWNTRDLYEQIDDPDYWEDDTTDTIENMFYGATAWLAKYRRISTFVFDYDDDDYDEWYGHPLDYNTFGPPSAWILRPEYVVNGTSGSDGSSGSSGSDFPEWGIALAGVALAISTVTSVFVLIQKLCCSGPKHHPGGMTYAMQPQPQPQRVVVAHQV